MASDLNEQILAAIQHQTEVLQKILDKIDESSGEILETNEMMITQNGAIKEKLDEVNLNLSYVLGAVQASD